MGRIYLVRHAQTEWNTQQRLQGQKDSRLTMQGRSQAWWLSEHLRYTKFDAAFSSTSGRTIETAEILLGDRDLSLECRSELCEMNFGSWEGRRIEDIESNDTEKFRLYKETPEAFKACGGESMLEAFERVNSFIRELSAKHADQTLLVVTHGLVKKLLITGFEERPLESIWEVPHVYPTSISILNTTDPPPHFESKLETPHLIKL
jgi:broad specificity phosphatase PhoE